MVNNGLISGICWNMLGNGETKPENLLVNLQLHGELSGIGRHWLSF